MNDELKPKFKVGDRVICPSVSGWDHSIVAVFEKISGETMFASFLYAVKNHRLHQEIIDEDRLDVPEELEKQNAD